MFSYEYKQLGKHIIGSAIFISNFLLFRESGYFDNVAETKPLLHLWSLAIEEQFYIFYPALLWFAWKKKFNLLIVIVCIGAFSFYLNLKGIKKYPIATFYYPHTRFWELLCGGCLAWVNLHLENILEKFNYILKKLLSITIYWKLKKLNKNFLFVNLISLSGMIMIIYGLCHINKSMNFPGKLALIPVVGTLLIIASGVKAWINRKILSNQFLIWFGLISYPLYLWHWILLSFVHIMKNTIPNIYVRILIVIISILFAWFTYFFVEKKIRFGNKNDTKVLLLIILMSLMGYLGYYTWKHNGLLFRRFTKKFEDSQYVLHHNLSFTQELGKPDNAKIMLLGDSHAAHYAPGLKKYFGDKIADYTSSGCIPFYDVDRYDKRFVPGECSKSMNSALNFFEKNKQMTGIILSSMGPVYLSGETFKEMSPERTLGNKVKSISNSEMKDPWEIYAYGMRYTLNRLSKANKKILFVIDVPELGFDPQLCFVTRPFFLTSKKRKKICAVSRQDYELRNIKYRSIIYSILKDFPNVIVYDPVDDICDDYQCWGMKDGKILYRDPDHLSSEGSFYLVSRMKPFIEKLM